MALSNLKGSLENLLLEEVMSELIIFKDDAHYTLSTLRLFIVVALFNAISASKQVIIAENSKKDESKEKHAKEKLPDDDLASRISSIKDIKSTRQPVRNSKWNALSEDTSATSATLKVFHFQYFPQICKVDSFLLYFSQNWDQESSDDEISKS